MKEKVIFLADIDGDIDDVLAIEYLHNLGRLEAVVLDGKTRNPERESGLKEKGVKFLDSIPRDTKTIFCGGALTLVAELLRGPNELDLLVMNGFFAGMNLVPAEHILPKFKNLYECRSYNPGLDPAAAEEVMRRNIKTLLVSKNVCHHPDNIAGKWHREKFDCRPDKKLHDVLMVKEGLNFIDDEESLCYYMPVDIVRGHGDKWAARLNGESNILITVGKK